MGFAIALVVTAIIMCAISQHRVYVEERIVSIPQEFKDRIGVVEITLSKFEDQNELWAKRWEQVVRVRVEFVDTTVVYLEPGDFVTLPPDQQTLVREAPSGP